MWPKRDRPSSRVTRPVAELRRRDTHRYPACDAAARVRPWRHPLRSGQQLRPIVAEFRQSRYTRCMRLLGVVRLSDITDETTSPERQLDKITTYAHLHDHEIAGVAQDLDVSGAVPPDRRPQLGPWLKRLDEWDAVIVAKFDRLSRSVRDFAKFCSWL